MSINNHLNKVLGDFLSKPSELISNQQLTSCIDLTLLNEQASPNDLSSINHLAARHQVAALCVFPKDLVHCKKHSDIHLATVINFPHGNQNLNECVTQINQSRLNGVKEIDYVIPFRAYLEGKEQEAINHAAAISTYCKEQGLLLKVILETGEFSDLAMLYQLTNELLTLNIDFLKTSTGKTPQGASLSAVFTLLSALKDSRKNCGIKVSGGIKTVAQAKNYAALAQYFLQKTIDKNWFRIGASSLLEELTKSN
ncbi:deoxyribose-phosphate aldolase [Legionella sp. km772]|uniref:deoxyribose-phosphate aldolase n=1 Tax=Legionella sp. km772 TaxID=2498111 RepID=UPI000F8D21D4|nr:deoxyribose-phosphate aldolase [Legionella sp. km772]RUR12293.1 deoxyribose-phosphate aldolase [Legionella sp. km772]